MRRIVRPALLICTLLALLPSLTTVPAAVAGRAMIPVASPHGLASLRLVIVPPRLEVGRDTTVRVTAFDNRGRPVSGVLVSLTGAGRPALGTTAKGPLALLVHPTALGTAALTAGRAGYGTSKLKLPVIPGAPATVAAIKSGMSILAPHAKPVAGKVGSDLMEDYHATTARKQYASLGLRDGTLVDLNANTDVLIKDPLHSTVAKGELFLQVVHGDSHPHVVQAGTAVAATKGTRLDVRYDPTHKTAVVTVVEGKVEVSNKGKTVLVGAGQQSTILLNRPPSPPRHVDLSALLVWLSNLPNSGASVVPPVLNVPAPPIVPVALPLTGQTPTMTITTALESTSWTGVVLVQGQITIPAGTTVNVQPGTTVLMDSNAAINVSGVLSARGNAGAPITFTSAAVSPGPNDWEFIGFDGASSSSSVLDFTRVFYGGYFSTENAEIFATHGAAPTISNSVIGSSQGDGIYLDSASPATISNCVFTANGDSAVSVEFNQVGQITGSRLGPNQTLGILVRDSTTLNQSAVMHRQDVPFNLANGLAIDAGAHLSVDAGTVIMMRTNASLTVKGVFAASGTPTQPIIFSSISAQPQANDWEFIDFSGAGTAGSILSYAQIFYGGYYNDGSAEVSAHNGANPTIDHCVISQSQGDGVYADDTSRPVVTNSTFAGNGSYGVSIPADDAIHTAGNSVAVNQTGIELRDNSAATVSGTWHRQIAPFVIDNGVEIAASATISIEPGTLILMATNGSLTVKGVLLARGTSIAPITVTSISAKPAPDDWEFIDLNGAAASASVLDHLQIAYGGYYNDSSSELSVHNGAAPTISNSVIAYSQGVGIYVDDGCRPIISNNLFSSNDSNAMSVPADDATLVTGTGLAPNQASVNVRGTAIAHSGTWAQQDGPLMLANGVSINAGVTITIAPGSLILMQNNASLTVNGTLLARGTADLPIYFTSARSHPAPEDWEYIDFHGASANASVLDYAQVSYGGYYSNGGAEISVSQGAHPAITHTLIQLSAGDGIYVEDGCRPTIAYNIFQKNQSYAISLQKKDPARVHDNQMPAGAQGLEIRG